ncbi:GntR family transcriptional regulator [Pseudidiomarina sp.]|uniref:GntR family transcriptional regulator n=1 Tax=Pseudidiomarina sp. TaxID=2081707 RepID=UPI003A97AAD7
MTVAYKTRTQIAVEAIREKILTGAIRAGEPLRQSALAEELEVSRIPIREALLQLEAEGLVEFEAHKGATATKLMANQVRELFELRALLECDLLRRSIPNLTAEDLQMSEKLLVEMVAAYTNTQTQSTWSELNFRFHISLYEAAQRPQTLDLVHNLMVKSDRYIRVHLSLAGGVDNADREHSVILESCRAREVDKACMLLHEHIERSANEIAEFLK